MGRRKVLPSDQDDDSGSEGGDWATAPGLTDEGTSEASISDGEDAMGPGSIQREKAEAAKRLKLAKEYLAGLGHDGRARSERGHVEDDDEADAKALDRELIAGRLRQDALKAKGKRYAQIAEEVLAEPESWRVTLLRGHNQTPTCVALTRDGSTAFTGSKGGDIIKWDVAGGKRLHTFGVAPRPKPRDGKGGKRRPGHAGQVLSIAVSFDGKFVATGGVDKTLQIWDGHKNQHLATFSQHRGAVTGLVFQYGTYQLYSCSADRTVKIWALDQLAYIDTLFGHQDAVPAIDALAFERCITVGSRDRTGRLWKIPEESQLIFRLSEEAGGGLECVRMVDEDHFITGSDTGTLSVWSLGKKKPFRNHANVHGTEPRHAIVSLATCPFTDLAASGSDSGEILLWRMAEDRKSLVPAGSVAVPGFVNGMAFAEDGRTLVAVVGRDHRLGRWDVQRTAQNRLAIVRF